MVYSVPKIAFVYQGILITELCTWSNYGLPDNLDVGKLQSMQVLRSYLAVCSASHMHGSKASQLADGVVMNVRL